MGVISLNLPYIAMISPNEEYFFNKLRSIAKDVINEQIKICNTILDTSVNHAPIMWRHGVITRANKDMTIREALPKFGPGRSSIFSVSIGYAGIAECAYKFLGEYISESGQKFGIKILETIQEEIDKVKSETGLALSIYGTPLESTVDKFAKAIKQFPVIEHVNDRDYITNSYHIPVEYQIDGYSKIDFEAPFQKYSSGGAISYVEMPDIHDNPEAVLNLIKHIYDNMLYCELNTTSCDVCYSCGYKGELDMDKHGKLSCPNCGERDQHKLYGLRRLCGYLGVITNGIKDGRTADIINRVKHF